jgi:hypothetical protein
MTRKKLSPIWFLSNPLDPEYKEYILLDYLKSLSVNLNPQTCYSITKEVSQIVRTLNSFKSNRKIDESILKTLKKKDKADILEFNYDSLDEENKMQLMDIVESSLQVLYEYSEVCLEILEAEESKIKIFKIQSKFSVTDLTEDSGIVIIRNMITDNLSNFYFKVKVKMETSEGQKEVSIMKKIHLKNTFFSLNYEYIYHEIINEIQQGKINYSPVFYVIEIYENFDEDSDIYKLAKEKFIDQICH